jgi:hypothetical protein
MQTLSFKSGKPYACTKLGAIVYFNPRIQGWFYYILYMIYAIIA